MLTILNKKMSGVGAQTLDSVSGRVIGGLALITIGIGVAYAYGTLKTEKKKASIISLVNEIQNAFPDSNFSGMTAETLDTSGALSSGSGSRNVLTRDGMKITITAKETYEATKDAATSNTPSNTYTLNVAVKNKKLCKKLFKLPLPGLTTVAAGGQAAVAAGLSLIHI